MSNAGLTAPAINTLIRHIILYLTTMHSSKIQTVYLSFIHSFNIFYQYFQVANLLIAANVPNTNLIPLILEDAKYKVSDWICWL